MNLTGRVVLITGGARRIGRAIALRLARSGCRLAIHYRSSQTDAAKTVADCMALGADAAAFAADLSDVAAAQRLVPAVVDRFGRLDVLINNASEFPPLSLDEFDPAKWEQTFRVNVTAPMILAHAAAGELRQNNGRIVNLCDAAAERPWPSQLAYCASKAALESVTKSLARALAPAVNVVGVAPGIAAWPEDLDEAARRRLIERIPLRRSGTPEDVASAVHYLLADGDYVTGAVLPLDGGRQIV